MHFITKFLSRKLLVVLIPVGLAIAKGVLCGSKEILDWKLISIIAFYILANVAQKVIIAWIKAKYHQQG